MSGERNKSPTPMLYVPADLRASQNIQWGLEISPVDGSARVSIGDVSVVRRYFYTAEDVDAVIARLVAMKEVMELSKQVLQKSTVKK